MGSDISLRFEKRVDQRWYPIDTGGWRFDNRDYELFYLLAEQRGYEKNTYPPIASCKGLPKDMHPLTQKSIGNIEWVNSLDGVSYYTLRDLLYSRYSRKMPVKRWVVPEEYEEYVTGVSDDIPYYVHYDTPEYSREGMVLKEWIDYLNYNLIDIIEKMKEFKQVEHIGDDNDIRMIFWID